MIDAPTIATTLDEWAPHPGPQWAFLESNADEVLYGGAAGGGKSDALLVEAVRDIDHPGYRGILFRRTFPELNMSLIDRARDLYGDKGRYLEAQHTWVFPSGARVMFAHIQRELDVRRYQSAAFAFIGFDELTSFTQYQYEYMLSRNRNTAGVFNRVRSATNPGGAGHSWVKSRFIDRLAPYTMRWFVRDGAHDVEVGETTKNARSRQFIPARVDDNPSLMEADPGYMARLEALPERERLMLLEGSWSVAHEGLVYMEFRPTIHVIDAFPIPDDWMKFRSIDFGFNNPFVCQWWALSPDDVLHLYREIYMSHQLVSDLGPQINELSKHDKRLVGTVADHDAENRAELEVKHQIASAPAEKTIREGISAVSVRMRPDPTTGKPRMVFHRDCTVHLDRRLLAAGLPTSTIEEAGVYTYPGPRDNRSPDELPLDVNNHGMDAMRYMVMLVEKLRTGRHRSRNVEGL